MCNHRVIAFPEMLLPRGKDAFKDVTIMLNGKKQYPRVSKEPPCGALMGFDH